MNKINKNEIPNGFVLNESYLKLPLGIEGEEVIIGWEEAPTRSGWTPITAFLITIENAKKIEEYEIQKKIATQKENIEKQQKVAIEEEQKEELMRPYRQFIGKNIKITDENNYFNNKKLLVKNIDTKKDSFGTIKIVMYVQVYMNDGRLSGMNAASSPIEYLELI